MIALLVAVIVGAVAGWLAGQLVPGTRLGLPGDTLCVRSRDPRDAFTAKGLTLDEARRIAANIAKLPKLLAKG
jgi:hypothetical protein